MPLPQMLSSHVSLAEFTASNDATRWGIDNTLPQALLANAIQTALMIERIRAACAKHLGHEVPVFLSSGYRCLTLNRRENSADTSDHVQAEAADIRIPGFGTPTEVARFLAPMVDVLGIGQLINEFPDRNGWVHVSRKMVSKPVNRIITITGHGTVAGIQEK